MTTEETSRFPFAENAVISDADAVSTGWRELESLAAALSAGRVNGSKVLRAFTVVACPMVGFGGQAMASQHVRPMTDSDETVDVHAFCREMLVGVWRTIALSIPELPTPLDDWVGSAYLICRMIDTLEERPGTSESDRQRMFHRFMEVLGPPVDVEAAGLCAANFADCDPHDPCSLLMSRADVVMVKLASFPDGAVHSIRPCTVEMTDGLRRTPLPPDPKSPLCRFRSMHQLERYCHYTAGVVGVMLTRLFA